MMTGSWTLRASLFSCSMLALSALMPAQAAAQGAAEPAQGRAPPEGPAADKGFVEEVVVTAQRRTENIQSVPISIQAFSGDKLEKAGITGVEQLQMMTPGLTMSRSATASTPFIRGIGSSAAGAGNEAAVALYVDGVYHELTFANTNSLPDVERIEVLKGPQGTLYGRNTTGGLIHIITKSPSQTPSGDFGISWGNYETLEAKGFLTGGLTDTIAASVSGYVRQQGKGYGRNLLVGGRISKRDEESVRGKIRYESDGTRITLAADYAHVTDDRGVQREALPGVINGLPGQPATYTIFNGKWHDVQTGSLPRTSPPFRRANGLTSGITDYQDWGASLTVEHSFDGFDAISISAYRNADVDLFGDSDEGRPFLSDALVDFNTKNFTQEVRLASNNKGRVNWIVGAFYLDGDSINYLEVPTVIVGQVLTKSYSAFAEVGFKLFDDAGTLTFGGRYTIDKRRIRGSLGGNPDFGQPGFPLPPPGIDPSTTWKKPTYRIVYSHQVNDDFMAYASYNRGFKSGNYNLIPATSKAYDPEILDAFEVGFKSTLADGRVRFNAAAFYYDYKALQLQVATNVSADIVNAAGAEVKGAEGDFSARVTDNLTVDLGASYVDGEYTNFKNAQVYVQNLDAAGRPIGGDSSISFDASGKRLVRSPTFTASAGVTYTQAFADGELIAVVRAQYNGSMSWEASGRLKEPSYTLVNASVGYEWNSGWALRVQGANIFDAKYSIATLSTNLGDVYSAGDPATYSVALSYKF
ncbi:MAG TPA: TonB-dependent receptor [Phenylobacterium sp.]|nr:TonB-dependent receptor [Phenylobacterium sp.]